MHQNRRRRAAIVGGSLGGLLAAHQLRAIGWDVDVFERAKEDLADRGAGISTHRALFEAMRRANCALDTRNQIVPSAYVCLDRDDRIIQKHPAWRAMTTWSCLYRPLRDNLPSKAYHSGMQLAGIEANAHDATALFSDGSSVTADLIIGADGFRSTVRGHIWPDVTPIYSGYVAWRALTPERELPPATWAKIRDDYVFCVPEGELLVSYAVPTRDDARANGQLSYNVVWYRPADAVQLRDLCTDEQGRNHDISIPPTLVRRDVISRMKADARALLSPLLADVIERTTQPFLQPIYDLASPAVVAGRVVLLGDAAFVARPHVGAGVTKAALDAMRLADAIASAGDDIEEALARYNAGCRAFGNWCVERGRQMGVRIKRRAPSGSEPSRQDLDRSARQSVEDYIETAKAIEARTGAPAERA